MAEVEGLVRALREGDDVAKAAAAWALGDLAYDEDDQVVIAAAGGIPPLVDLLRDGSAEVQNQAAWALKSFTFTSDAANLVAAAGGIPPLVELLRDEHATWHTGAKSEAFWALHSLARNNDANAIAIAAAVSLEALVQLARRGRVTVENQWVVRDAALPAKRKAALVVAKLVSACVPDSVPRDIKAVIVSYLWPAATHEPASSDEEPQESDEDDSESSFFEFREDDVDY